MRKLPILLFLVIASMPKLAWGQSLSLADSTEAAVWLVRSRAALMKNRPDSADFYQKKAFFIFQKNNALAGWFSALTDRAVITANELERPLDAVNFIKNNEKNAWRDPKTAEEWKAKIRFTNFGDFFAEVYLGDFQLGRFFLEASFSDFNQHLGPKEKQTAYYIFGQLGNICTRLGDFERAQILLKQKAEIALKNHDYDRAAEALHDLAIVFREVGQIDSSIVFEQRALAVPDGERPLRPSHLSGLAGYFLLKNDLVSAEKACREARSAYQNLPREKKGEAAFALSEIAENEAKICLARCQFGAAKSKYALALKLTIADLGSDDRRETAKIRIQLGEIELLQGRPEAALAYFQTALQNVLPGFFEKNVAKNPLPDQFYAENTIREALDGKARAWQLKGKSETAKGKIDALENALACHLLLEEIEQKLRETYQFESSSLQALDEGHDRLGRATAIAHALFEETGDPKFAHQAFFFCEKSKGLLLLQGIARARSDFKLPADLRFREQSVNSRVAFLEKSILGKNGATATGKSPAEEIRKLEDELLRAKNDQQKFWDEIKTSHPDFWKISQIPIWATAGDLKNLLEPDQNLVEYFVGEGHVFVFRASADGQFSVRKTALPPDFLLKIDWLRHFLGKYDPSPIAQSQFIETSAGLFKLLLGEEMSDPVFSKNKRLLVVPDGVLGFVPFEVLLENLPQNFAQNPVAINWGGLDFLLKKKAISYAWSASLLREQLKKMPVAGLKNFAAFLPDYSKCGMKSTGTAAIDRGSDGNLPGAKAETEAIEKLIGGQFFRNGAASRDNFLQRAGQFRIIHMAGHADSDDREPALSHLSFTCENGQADGANCLFINDLQQIALRAELAVLSACETGTGKLHRGEGVYSLARGFALAGVSATLMSLWRLSDESTPELMSVFYQKIKDGQRKDDALQAAKLDWLTGPSAMLCKHPYFWAGVVANGNMRPIEVSGGGHLFEWMAFFGLVTVLLYWFSVKYNFFSKLKSTFAPAKN